MSTLAENIKLYNPFNNRLLALQAIILLCLLLVLFAGRIEIAKSLENRMYPALILFCYLSTYLLGALVAVIQVDLLTKPFSACLPNQNKIQASTLFLAGITASLFYYAILLLLPHPAGFKGLLYFITNVSIGLSFFLIGAFLTFYIQNKREIGQAVLIFNIMSGLVIYLLITFDILTIPLDYFLYHASVPLLILAISLATAMRKKILHPNFKRTLALKDFSLSDYSNMTSTIQQADIYMLKRLSDRVKNENSSDGFFSREIKKYPYFSLRRSITAEIYSMIDRYYTLNERNFIAMLLLKIVIFSFLLLVTGYQLLFIDINDTAARGAHFISSMFSHFILAISIFGLSTLASIIFHPANHKQLLPEGRSKYFCSSIIIWIIKQVIIAVWAFLVILTAQLFQNIMPGLTFSGLEFHYSAPGFSIIFWALVIVPVVDLFMYYFKKPCALITMLIFIGLLFFLSIYSIFTINPTHSFLSMALAILLANGFFIERLARYWFKKDIE